MEDAQDDLRRQLAGLGKGLVQANLRLGRVVELLEAGGREAGPREAGPATHGALELLLELLDTVDRTLSSAAAPAPPRRFWQRAPSPPPDLGGLRLAAEHTLAQLRLSGLERAPTEGKVDPRLHRVVEALPTPDRARDGTLATTHQSGWYRPGDPPTPLRHAHVSAWRHQEP